jgi:hypothetical protein
MPILLCGIGLGVSIGALGVYGVKVMVWARHELGKGIRGEELTSEV